MTSVSRAEVPIAYKDWSTAPLADESFHSDIPQDLHVDEHDGTEDSTPAVVLRRISAEINSMSKQHEFIEAFKLSKWHSSCHQ